MKPADNIYVLHELLSTARAPVSFANICETLGNCSPATAHRVIKELRDGRGAPIKRTRDPYGYRYTDEAFQLVGFFMTPTQLHALLLLQQLLRSFEPGLLDKLVEPARQWTNQMLAYHGMRSDGENRIRLLKMAARPPGPCFNTVASATIQRRRMFICYDARGTGEASEREVSPQRLIHYRDKWYLDAWCHKQEALRIFRVDNIPTATMLETPAVDIPDEAINAEFTQGYGIYSGPVTATAILRFSPGSARWVDGEQWHPAQVATKLESGEYLLEIPYSRPDELIMDIMRYGAEVEVLAPAELRQMVVDRHRAAVALYKAG
jgi:predicted DNA-binding transcriptional regulator YafY